MNNQNLKVGIVGLGIMGRGMANNFIKKGFTLFIWNRTQSVCDEFSKQGAVVCSTPAEVAQKADVIFEITANDESSKEVWMGEKGILAGASTDKVLIASATLSVEWVDELVAKCKNQKFTFMDIALTGGRVGAETGSLTVLCGGDEATLQQIEPVLQAVAKKIFHFGPAGHGMRYKLILNFLQAVHIIGFGQAMKIAKAYDMDLKKVSEALVDRPGGTITGIAQKTYFEEPNPITFSIEWISKDLTYAKKLAKNLDVCLLDGVLSEYKKAMEKGHSKRDWASINTLIEEQL
ncbi:MAG: NAD(P)-dependent oxidoreductase [Patescibacteria group bacterium]